MAQGDGGTIKTGKCWKCWSSVGARWDEKMLEMLEQQWSKVGWENVGNVGATVEQGGMGKCWICWSKVGARWTGKMSEQKMVYDIEGEVPDTFVYDIEGEVPDTFVTSASVEDELELIKETANIITD